MMQAPTALVAASFVLALACSATPSPNTSSDAAGSASGGNAGASSAGGGGAGIAGNSAPSGGAGGAGGNASAGAASGGSAQAGSGGTVAGTAGSAGSEAGGSGGLPPIQECMSTPSVDRLTQWTASGEGTTVPATGSILVKDGSEYVAKVQFVGSDWHVIPVLIANKFGDVVDLSKAATFTLTYSATSALHVQLRSKSHWSGGDQYATDIPSTNGMVETHTFSFAEANWKSLFGAPALSYADTLKEGMGLVFVGNTENTVIFSGLRIDGYTPPCQ